MVVTYGIANIAAAVVEELYFRGYLLPRLSSLKNGAPFANAALFALQHFLSPWQQVGIFLGILPQVYVVYKKQNIFIGIIAHSLLNLLSSLLLTISVFG
jgi:membrane protease YdiL (CAAX protease family)